MSSFLTELWSTEKSCTVSFNETSLCSSFVKSSDMVPKQKSYTNICYLFPLTYKSPFYLHTSNYHHYCKGNI